MQLTLHAYEFTKGEIAMRHLSYLAVWLTVVFGALVGQSFGQDEVNPDVAKPDKTAAELSLVGSWNAKSISPENGKLEAFGGQNNSFNVLISEKNFVMYAAKKILANMSYTLDSKQEPYTLDLKSDDGVMLGICVKRANNLEICLNEEAKGRPHNFDMEKNDLLLVLRPLVRPFQSQSVFMIDADGSNLHQIPLSPEYTNAGSFDWSPDGSKIALDVWRSEMGENLRDAHILVMDVDGSSLSDLGPGAMPSWSPDGKRLTYCQYKPNNSVWIMNADGSDHKLIDKNGWGSQWSPKSDEIAYVTHKHGAGANLCIYDVAKGHHRMVLDRPFGGIFWGLTWSPDATWICFKADLHHGGSEVAAVNSKGESEGFKVILPKSVTSEFKNINETMAWGGTGNQILFSIRTKTNPMRQLYIYDFADEKSSPQLVSGLPANWDIGDMTWSPDGKKIVFSARTSPKSSQPQ